MARFLISGQNKKFFFSILFLCVTLLTPFHKLLAACESQDSQTDQSIVLVIDVSSSVEEDETVLQLKAYETALSSSTLKEKLLGCGCSEISVVVFGGISKVITPPKLIVDEGNISELTKIFKDLTENRTSGTPLYQYFQIDGGTAINTGVRAALDILTEKENTSPRKVILVSGDGVNSRYSEKEMKALQQEAFDQAIAISGVAIKVGDEEDLISYYPRGDGDNNSGDSDFGLQLGGRIGKEQFTRQSPPSIKYNSLKEYYQNFVVTPFEQTEEAQSYETLADVLSTKIERIACTPIS